MSDKLHQSITGSIEADSPLPLYYQLKELLKKHIADGLWEPDEAIPTERDLCDIFHVSRTTVRQAVSELVNEGLLYRSQGRGTFVAKQKLKERFIQQDMGFHEEMTRRGLRVETEVLEQSVIAAPGDIAAQLQIYPGDKVSKIERLRSVQGELVVIVVSYIRLDLCPDLVEVDLNDASLYQVIHEKYRLKVETGKRTIEAISVSDLDAQLLGISKDVPLLLIKSIGYLADGRPLEYYEAKHRGDRCKLEVEFFRNLIK